MFVKGAVVKKRIQVLAVLGLVGLLSACASSSSRDISLIPTQIDELTQKKGAFTQPVKWSKTKPDCKGTCPKMTVDSVVFPGKRALTDLVDQTLAAMVSQLNSDHLLPTIDEFEGYYWKTAAPADEVNLAAKPIYRNKHLTVLELGAWQYHTGAAHGMSTTQFIIWSNEDNQPLVLADLLRPRQEKHFLALQEQAHEQWLSQLDFAQEDPEQYRRLWPFQPTENIALIDQGVLVKYDPYEIAPYAAGMPSFVIPYQELSGVLKDQFLPTYSD